MLTTAPTAGRELGLRHRLALLLVVKVVALLVIWSLFFRPALRVEVDGERAAQQLLGESSVEDAAPVSTRDTGGAIRSQ